MKTVYRVLVADDNKVNLSAYQKFLNDPSIHVMTASTLNDARDLFTSQDFDLVLVDIAFRSAQVDEGLAFLKQIRQQNPKVRTVLITNADSPEIRARASDVGVSLYLEKPLLSQDLHDQMLRLLSGSDTFIPRLRKYLGQFWIRNLSKLVQFSLDAVVLILAFWFAYLLRFDFSLNDSQIQTVIGQFPFVYLIQFFALMITGVYSYIWRFVGLREVKAFVLAAIVSLAMLLFVRLVFPVRFQILRVPISIAIVDTILGFGGVMCLRIIRRVVYEKFQKKKLKASYVQQFKDTKTQAHANPKPKNVFLIGAGQAGLLAAKEILNRGGLDIALRGFIDDDPAKIGTVIHGIRVIGSTPDLPELVARHKIDYVIITIATASRTEITRIVQLCDTIPIKARIIPGLFELIGGKVEVSRIRDVEIEDLLGRERVELEVDTMSDFITGKRVMVTGAGGSIGSELVRQVFNFHPESILMVERSEFALYLIQKEMGRIVAPERCIPLIADIADEARMDSIFTLYKPQIILHAAAHKHVPLMEFNPAEAIKNNSLASWKLAHLAGKRNAEVFVLISTDKAVNPTSIMGASKRLAELLVQSMNSRFQTKFLAVRFGNVLGSTGSVIPLFKEQIARGGPVTVTHPDMTRYFMTIPEASQLVLQAGAIGAGGEIFILDMGAPIKIVDLAESMIRLSGMKPNVDIRIEFTGLRPGEKLFEELNTTDDQVSKTVHPKIFIGKIKAYAPEVVDSILDRLIVLSGDGDESKLRSYINDVLPEASISK